MLDLSRKNEGIVNQGLQKRKKMLLLLQKSNSNRTQQTRQCRNQTMLHPFVGMKKRIALQKGHFAEELMNANKERKKTSRLTMKCSRPSSINKEIKNIEHSICRLTKEFEEERRKESNKDTKISLDNIKTEQKVPEFSYWISPVNGKLKNNHKDFKKRRLGVKNKVVTDVTSSHIPKYNNGLERSRRNSLEPTMTGDNITGMLSPSSNKSSHNGMGPRKLKKIYNRLDRVKDVIRSINAMEIRASVCSDGMNHKDTPQKKNSSDQAEGNDTKGNDHYRNILNIVRTRRIMNRNRMFASRPPLLETVIEEPEKEEEEAKLYEML
ncbi:uncharacterized protein [Halyomorpha halys]|uniref:uncharacterized protein n=1 Tax=Halyomorpha halys TaxID=286706 RepID=UPI0006D51F6D|nr:uncharacterized protein LOC106689402 [Halyomorpha halys]